MDPRMGGSSRQDQTVPPLTGAVVAKVVGSITPGPAADQGLKSHVFPGRATEEDRCGGLPRGRAGRADVHIEWGQLPLRP